MLKRLAPLVLAVALVFILSGRAAAENDYGIWVGYQGYLYDLGTATTETQLETTFLGAFTAGRFSMRDFRGDYRVACGASDSVWRTTDGEPVQTDGSFYTLEGNGGLRLKLQEGLDLRLLGGASYWWGSDAADHDYNFFQVQAGVGLVKSFSLGRLSLEAESSLSFVLDYLYDGLDFSAPFLFEGLRADASLAAIFNVSPNLILQTGLRTSVWADRDLFDPVPQSSLAGTWSGWFGLRMVF